jgi:PAS domain S-box-containing protein
MDVRSLLEHTGAAAFAVDQDGRVVGWTAAAERLLGHPAEAALGRPCHALICGTDPFGNLYCRKDCNLREMIRREEPIQTFGLKVRNASGQFIPIACSVLTLSETQPCRDFSVLHLLQPVSHWKEAGYRLERIRRQAGRSDDASGPDHGLGSSDPATALTRRETEILRLLAQGYATHELAKDLSVSVNTVRTHTRNILHKLEAHSKLQAVSLARHQKLI